jgi:hypothetical protein
MSRDSQRSTVGFHDPAHRRRVVGLRTMAVPEVIASIALAACTALAVTVVSIEIAQADTFAFAAGVEESGLALAALLGLTLAAVGSVFVSRSVRHR